MVGQASLPDRPLCRSSAAVSRCEPRAAGDGLRATIQLCESALRCVARGHEPRATANAQLVIPTEVLQGRAEESRRGCLPLPLLRHSGSAVVITPLIHIAHRRWDEKSDHVPTSLRAFARVSEKSGTKSARFALPILPKRAQIAVCGSETGMGGSKRPGFGVPEKTRFPKMSKGRFTRATVEPATAGRREAPARPSTPNDRRRAVAGSTGVGWVLAPTRQEAVGACKFPATARPEPFYGSAVLVAPPCCIQRKACWWSSRAERRWSLVLIFSRWLSTVRGLRWRLSAMSRVL